VKFVGVDLATESVACGVCALEGNAVAYVGRGNASHKHPDWLLEHCLGADAVGVDVPFGWPAPFVEALRDHEIGAAFRRDRRPYRLRTTDVWLADTLPRRLARDIGRPTPFSVSTDKLGATAMVGTVLLQALSDDFRLSPRRSGVPQAVLEVYPAASLWAWGLRHRNIEVPATLGVLREAFGLEIRKADLKRLLESRHCFDALVAALTAREYGDGNTFDPPEDVPDGTLRLEGWIRVPKRLLDGAHRA
jgi:predicted nuclease with RNAse H fold